MERRVTKTRQAVRGVVGFLVYAAILFVPAGRIDWREGWIFLGVSMALLAGFLGWALRRDPDLMRERATRASDAEAWDVLILRLYSLLLVAMLVLCALDSGRCSWSAVPAWARAIGWIGLLVGLGVGGASMLTNTFASEVVRIQEDRGHRPVTSGPYRIVRHPMYVGVIVAMPCIPVVLGSWWGLTLAGPIVVLFVVRTAIEDRVLRRRLDGYEEYAARVRHRLLPGIW